MDGVVVDVVDGVVVDVHRLGKMAQASSAWVLVH